MLYSLFSHLGITVNIILTSVSFVNLLFLQISINQTFEFFLVFEVTVGADFQFGAGWFIADDDAVGVHLDGADGPHVIDAFLYSVLQGTGFVMAVAEDKDFAG